MRVLMLGWEYPPFSSGGLGTHCYNMTRSLSQKGTDITFLMPGCSDDLHSEFARIVRAGKLRLMKVGSVIRPYLPSLPISKVSVSARSDKGQVYGEGFLQEVRKYNDLAAQSAKDIECDVIHCHDWMTFPAGIRIKEEKSRPLVVTVHSTEFDRTGSLAPNPWICDIEWQGLYHADRVIAVSNYMKNMIMDKYSVPEEKIDVVYNSIEPGNYCSESREFGLGEKVVLFLGRLTLQKGPDHFLKAAKLVLEKEKCVRFVMAGTGDMLPQLIDQAISLGISDRVTFTGFVDSVEDCYRMADLYVMPSVSEPFGITALEAMASGAPVMVSRQSGVQEMVGHRLAVDFWDVESMASNMIGVLRYQSLSREMRANGLREVSRLSWADSAEQTLSVYSKTIN